MITMAASEARLPMMETMTTTKVSAQGGAEETAPRMKALSSPTRSASPMPSMTVMIRPSGGKETKFSIMLVSA